MAPSPLFISSWVLSQEGDIVMNRSSYILHRIPKRSGGWREILEPIPELKRFQRRILAWLLARKVSMGRYAHGFVRGRSIVTHAKLHAGKKVVVRLDIRDFFPSVSRAMLQSCLLKEGLTLHDAQHIAETCTVDGRLPQGAPTSPFLANLAFKHLDVRLAGLARKFRPGYVGTYSRYADDLVFSSNAPDWHVIVHPVRKIVESAGFKLHPGKTHVMRQHESQAITGLVVNVKANVPREYRRNFRACLHHIRHDASEVDWDVVRGKASFIHQANPVLGRELLRQVNDLKLLYDLRKEVTSGRHHDP